MDYTAIVWMMWLGDVSNTMSAIIGVLIGLGLLGEIIYIACHAINYDDETRYMEKSDKKAYSHSFHVKSVVFGVILAFLIVIECMLPSKTTIYAAAGANLAKQIETETTIPKHIDALLTAIENNLNNCDHNSDNSNSSN